jgi:hypothetical protein
MRHLAVENQKASRVWIDQGWVCLRLIDDREIRFPAAKNRRLRGANPQQLANVELICDGTGIHWPDLDEDLSVAGILEGRIGPE